MNENISAKLSTMNTNKTFPKPFKNLLRESSTANNVKKVLKSTDRDVLIGTPLTTKVALEYLLNGKLKSEVCRYCLKLVPGLSELDQVMQIAGTGTLYKVTIRQMIACFYPYKANQDPNFPEKICQKCLDRAISAYLFTQQCEQAERALLNCLDDMHEKLEKLDPIDRPKKRGRQKLNPNYNVLYSEHNKVIDYAEPIRSIINVQAESLTKEPVWSELECKKCWQVLPNIESLLNHEKLHPKSMWYHCRLCGKSFVKQIQLKKHHNQVHVLGRKSGLEADKTFKCNECGNVCENYIQHLQHIEKHKFKTMMKHLIEKKTDCLCMICLNKNTDLVELDNIVSIHGGYPELVGDTSLYTVLASTLPDQKSYKYQELYVPHKANIMTITERKRKLENIEHVPNRNKNTKVQYVLSQPSLVSKNKFKTDDFYYYVFCEPQTDIEIISIIDTETPRTVEITDKEPNDVIGYTLDKQTINEDGHSDTGAKLVHYIAPVNDNKHFDPDEMVTDHNESVDLGKNINFGDTNNVKDQIGSTRNSNVKSTNANNMESMDLIETCNPVAKTMDLVEDINIFCKQPTDLSQYPNLGDLVEPCFEKQKTNSFKFCNPIILEEANSTTKLNFDKAYTFNFTDLSVKTNNQEIHDVQPTMEVIYTEEIQENSELMWVFKAPEKLAIEKVTENMTEDKNQIKINKVDCKLCWVFKHLDQCDHCQKPTTTAANISDKQYSIVLHDNFSITNTENDNKNVDALEKSTDVMFWKCSVCLTNNNLDRFACHYCESKQNIDKGDCRVNFGNSKAFFDSTKEQQTEKLFDFVDKNIFDAEKGIRLSYESVPFIEQEAMDFNIINKDNNEKEMANIEHIDTQNMDIEMEADKTDTPVVMNDEQMDFEENPYIPGTVQSFNILPLNVQHTNTLPYMATNVQFNIGSNPDGRANRKTKRPFRNVSKAFHK